MGQLLSGCEVRETEMHIAAAINKPLTVRPSQTGRLTFLPEDALQVEHEREAGRHAGQSSVQHASTVLTHHPAGGQGSRALATPATHAHPPCRLTHKGTRPCYAACKARHRTACQIPTQHSTAAARLVLLAQVDEGVGCLGVPDVGQPRLHAQVQVVADLRRGGGW